LLLYYFMIFYIFYMLIFQFVHTNRIAISVSKCELQQRSFTGTVGFFIFIFIFLLFEKKRKVTVQSDRACSLFGYGQKNINIDPTESIFSAKLFYCCKWRGRGETTTMPSTFFLSRRSHLSSSCRSKKLPWLWPAGTASIGGFWGGSVIHARVFCVLCFVFLLLEKRWHFFMHLIIIWYSKLL